MQTQPLVLLDVSSTRFVEARNELHDMPCGQLITPLTRYSNIAGLRFAIDNGAYSGFNVKSFKSLLEREWPNRDRCLFVAAPDVVGDALRTMELFNHFKQSLHGYPVALVAQDGIENLPIPWNSISAVFIGGTTGWKLSSHAAAVVRAAKALSKWVHVGRVNNYERYQYFAKLGADSVDGTGLSRYTGMCNTLQEEATMARKAKSHVETLDDMKARHAKELELCELHQEKAQLQERLQEIDELLSGKKIVKKRASRKAAAPTRASEPPAPPPLPPVAIQPAPPPTLIIPPKPPRPVSKSAPYVKAP